MPKHGDVYIGPDGITASLCVPMLSKADEKPDDDAHFLWGAFLIVDGVQLAFVGPTPAEEMDWPELDYEEAAAIGHEKLTRLGFARQRDTIPA